MNWRASYLLACWLPMAAHAVDIEPGKDPVPSVMWAFYHKQLLGDAPFVFDDRVKLLAPPFAEDARQVPLEIDARAFKGEVVVIDTGPSKRYGEAMRKAIAAITDKPVIQVLLTHHHPDHVLGNQAFSDVPIGALAGTSELLHQQGDAMAENMYRLVGDWMRGTEVVLPTQTLTPGVSSFGNHDLRLLSLGGHTGADLAILDRKTGVLFAGDLVFYQRALTTPNSPGLSVWLSDIATLRGLPWTLLVPGHGPVASDQRPFEQMHDYLTWLDQLMRAGAANGSDMAEMIRSAIPERFAGISLSRYELIRSVSHLYPRYERTQMTRVDSPTIK